MGARRVTLFAILAGAACSTATKTGGNARDGGESDASDAANVADSASDAPSDGGVGDAAVEGGRWCATRSRAFFCDDFDDPNVLLGVEWTGPHMQQGGGTIAYSTLAKSLPRSFVSKVPAIDAGYAQGVLQHTLTAPANVDSIRAAFSLHVSKLGGGNGYDSVASVVFEDALCQTRTFGSKERRVALVFGGGGTTVAVMGFTADCVDAGEDFQSLSLEGAPPDNPDGSVWDDWEIVAARAPCATMQGSSISLRKNGNLVRCIPTGIDPMTKTGKLELRLGSGEGAVWSASQLEFDNVEMTSVAK